MALIKCPDCGKAVSDSAPSCLGCGRPIAKVASIASPQIVVQAAPKKGTSIFTWLVLLFIVAIAIASVQHSPVEHKNDASSPVASIAAAPTARPTIKATPSALLSEYRKNEVSTDDKLAGRDVIVHGDVTGISKSIFNSIVVELDTGDRFNDLRAFIVEEDHAKAAALQKGMEITIRCESFRYSVGSPVGDKCVLQ